MAETAAETALVALGAVARPHGVRGELRVHRFNPDSPVLLDRASVWLRTPDGKSEAREVKVERARPHGELVLLTLEGVVGREAAEALRGHAVCSPREDLPPPDEDELYHIDLVGLSVRTESGEEIGVVSEVIRYPSVDCLLVEGADGVREIPILEPYLVDVDFEARVAVVRHHEDFEARRKR